MRRYASTINNSVMRKRRVCSRCYETANLRVIHVRREIQCHNVPQVTLRDLRWEGVAQDRT